MQARTALGVLGLAATPLLLAAPAQADTVNFHLSEQNDSGASADATITSNANGSITVRIDGTGFTPNAPHAQHLHGDAAGNFFCPTPDADKNGDGQVATEEGVAQYGGVVISLTTKGDTSAKSGLAVDRFPVADAQGNLNYRRTISAGAIPDGIAANIDNLHIVQHGLDVNGNGKYDMDALGESVFAKSLGVEGIPEEATNPATCGEVAAVGGVETGSGTTAGLESGAMLGFGGLALAGSAGALLMRRRFAEWGERS
jgi:hypothetical protein